MTIAISTEAPKVFFSNDRLVTTSQAIADYFDKQHKHILEKIRALDCSPEFTTANFSTVVIKVQAGFMEKDAEGYEVTKDGFMFLVMGFTGKKAARLKEAYIAKFNKMEAELQTRSSIPVQHGSPQTHAMIVYFENGVPVGGRPLAEGEIPMSPNSCLEHVMRAGFVTIPCDEVGKLTMDELWLMAEETKKLRDRVQRNYQELATRYNF